MKDIINRVFEKKLVDGTIEKIVSDSFDGMVKDICRDQMSWNGEVKKAIEEKLKPIMLQAIEKSNLADLVAKIAAVINAGIEGSALDDYKDLLASTRGLFKGNELIEKYKAQKKIKITQILAAYVSFIENEYDESDFDESDFDYDERKTAAVECSVSVAEEEKQIFSFRKSGYIVELTNEKSDDERSTDIKFRLVWNYDNTSLHIQSDFRSLGIGELRNVPNFIVFLSWLENKYIPIEVDETEESYTAYIEAEGY